MGIAIESVGEGAARLRMSLSESHLNSDGILHGGVLPALADAAMGSAARTLHGAEAKIITAESNIRYLRAVRGGVVVGQGRVVKAGRRLVVAEADMLDDAGALVARAGGTFVLEGHEP